MRITIVSEYARPWPGGISEHVHYEASGLAALGHDVTIVSGPGAVAPPGVAIAHWRHALPLPSNGASGRLSLDPRGFKTLWRRLRPDVVHVHAPLDPVLPLVATLTAPVPVVGTFHASFDASLAWRLLYDRRWPWIARAQAQLACCIAVSTEARRSAEQYLSAPFEIIPNGVDLGRFAPRRTLARPKILFVGRPDPRKGLPVLVDACAALGDVELHIVGPVTNAMRAALQTRAPRLQMTFHGYVAPEDMAAHFADASLCCAPSLGSESQGIVLLEAMASGVPVVASNIAGYRDVVRHQHDGWLVAPNDVSTLRHALRTLLDDGALRTRLSVAARQTAERYAWPEIIRQIARVLSDVRKVKMSESVVPRNAA